MEKNRGNRVFSAQPAQIDEKKHFFDAFGHMETEISAAYVVKLCQRKGGWEPFTSDEIEQLYQEAGHKDGFTFNRLVEPGTAYGIIKGHYKTGGGWVTRREDGQFEVTEDFVDRVFKSSPRT